MSKHYVTVELFDNDNVVEISDAVKYVRSALDYYQSQAMMDLYKVHPAGPSLGGDDSESTNSAMEAIATCSICQCELDRRAVCHSCWVAGPPPQQHQ